MALDSAKKSTTQKPSDLLYFRDNVSELLTCIFCRLVELQSLSFCNYLFSCLTHCTYFSNLNSKLLLVNTKKHLDLHLGTYLFRYIFYLLLKSAGAKVRVNSI